MNLKNNSQNGASFNIALLYVSILALSTVYICSSKAFLSLALTASSIEDCTLFANSSNSFKRYSMKSIFVLLDFDKLESEPELELPPRELSSKETLLKRRLVFSISPFNFFSISL